MTRGMKVAVITHVIGTAVAILVAWFLIGEFGREESRSAMQRTFLVAGGLWGVWMLWEILRGRSTLARRVIAMFDRGEK